MPRTAEIIAVGSELLTGGVTNTNAAFLSRLLTAAGCLLYTSRRPVVGADEAARPPSPYLYTNNKERTICTRSFWASWARWS